MPKRISRDARKLILDDLVLIGSCAGGQYVAEFAKRVCPDIEDQTYQYGARTVPVINDIARHMDSFKDWDFTYLFDTVLDLLNVSDEKFIYFCEQYVNPVFRRQRLNEDDEWVDIAQECIDAINQGLSDIGMSLQPIGQIAGRIKYKVLPTNQGAQEPIKNIIFAAKYKPDIVLDDALSNDIRVVNANGALIYDQGIPADGISWENLATWYELLDLDNTETQMAHVFYNCLDSEPERLFYKAYISYLKSHGKHIPALIPQVYMYYDPKTKAQRECAVLQSVHESFAFVGDAEAATEVKDSVVIVQGQSFQKTLQFLETFADFWWIGFVGFCVGLVQLIQDCFTVAVTGIKWMGIYVGFQPICDLIHGGTS